MAAADIRGQAQEVALGWSPPGAPDSWQLTAALFGAIADHDDLHAALSELPVDRLPALLASAAICSLVRRDRPDPLAAYFPQPGGPQPIFDAGFAPAARAFVSASLPEIAAVCTRHRYQMNEVARCTQVALGIAAVTGPAAPLALVDLGTGAGLGLHVDRYAYQVDGTETGPPGASLTLSCAVRGRYLPPRPALPPVVSRTGIEADPVDLDDPAAREWLTACAPPEAGALTRLAAAIEVARAHPAPVVGGDVIEALPGVLASLPTGLPVVVTDSYLAVFLPAERRAKLTNILAAAGRVRPVTWLSLDPLVPLGPAGRDSVQDLPLPRVLAVDRRRAGVFAVLGVRTFGDQEETATVLACAHPSGQWVEWLAPGPEAHRTRGET